MVNKPKIQGTAFETLTVNKLNEYGFKSKRLAEGGSKDKGDIECEVPFADILPYPKIILSCLSSPEYLYYHGVTSKLNGRYSNDLRQ